MGKQKRKSTGAKTGDDGTASYLARLKREMKRPLVSLLLLCSALSGWEWREEALRAGMAEYLQNQFSRP
jgi:hypothetical protein